MDSCCFVDEALRASFELLREDDIADKLRVETAADIVGIFAPPRDVIIVFLILRY